MPRLVRTVRSAARAVAPLLLLLVLACHPSGHPLSVSQPEPVDHGPTGQLHAGAAEVDITPIPDLPSHGYSSAGPKKMRGYWLRLKARIIALEDAMGTRVVLVQADLGASSALLHRRVAAQLADVGIGPHNLLLATTHTHGGPGGFFGHRFFNEWVAASPGYDPELVEHLAQRICMGVRQALSTMRPARLGVAWADVDPSAVHNRSEEAWQANYASPSCGVPQEARPSVDRRVTVVRIDQEHDEALRPLAAWVVFAVHGTAIDNHYEHLHGDIHGVASRLMAHRVARELDGVGSFVAAVANGAEGDVSPGPKTEQGKEVVMRVGGQISDAAYAAYRSLDAVVEAERSGQHLLHHGFREVWMPAASTSRGRLCLAPTLGLPQLAGSEEGRSPFYGKRIREGIQSAADQGCLGRKVVATKGLHGAIFPTSDFPGKLPFQVVHLGDLLTLATVPGEPTVEVGRAIEREVAAASGRPTVVVGLANGYATYFTMPCEYDAQHYEGGATLYGKYQGLFAVETLATIARDMVHGDVVSYARTRTFSPTGAVARWPKSELCDATDWEAEEIRARGNVVQFRFRGLSEDARCELPRIRIVCRDQTLVDANGYPQTDEGFSFEVGRRGADRWTATWTTHAPIGVGCRFEVDRPGDLEPLRSREIPVIDPDLEARP